MESGRTLPAAFLALHPAPPCLAFRPVPPSPMLQTAERRTHVGLDPESLLPAHCSSIFVPVHRHLSELQ